VCGACVPLKAWEECTDAQAETIRDYCLAVRSALTADGRPPLEASGWKLHDRLSQIEASLARVAEKGGPPSLKHRHQVLTRALQATASLWPPLELAYAWVHHAAHLLTNADRPGGAQVRAAYHAWVSQMQEQKAKWGHGAVPSITWSNSRRASLPGCFTAMMWLICHGPTMIWNAALALCALMNGEPPGDEEPALD